MINDTNDLKVRATNGNHLYAEGLSAEQAAKVLLVLLEAGYPSFISNR